LRVTVIGSVAAVIVGMAFGFTVVLTLAALCYVLAFVAVGFSRAETHAMPSLQTRRAGHVPVNM
jgi:hypothetical protein